MRCASVGRVTAFPTTTSEHSKKCSYPPDACVTHFSSNTDVPYASSREKKRPRACTLVLNALTIRKTRVIFESRMKQQKHPSVQPHTPRDVGSRQTHVSHIFKKKKKQKRKNTSVNMLSTRRDFKKSYARDGQFLA